MFHIIESVSALPDFKLLVQFAEDTTKLYDISSLVLQIPAFAKLKNDPLAFHSVKVDIGGYGIIWDDELDLSNEELWENGISVMV